MTKTVSKYDERGRCIYMKAQNNVYERWWCFEGDNLIKTWDNEGYFLYNEYVNGVKVYAYNKNMEWRRDDIKGLSKVD